MNLPKVLLILFFLYLMWQVPKQVGKEPEPLEPHVAPILLAVLAFGALMAVLA